ncbi:MAG: hypothetical protein PHY50_07545, partial [Sideroxydans sp.]|nr:hypothetical protein [Sideroxydans sp.]
MAFRLSSTPAYLVLGSSIVLTTLSACGGGSSSSTAVPSTPAPTPLTGVFIDAPVANINYQTATQNGTTNANGEFKYLAGENVTFSIGSMVLPAAPARARVSPMDLVNTISPLDLKAINIARVLQALDSDGNPANGITIPASAAAAAPSIADFANTAVLDTAFAGAFAGVTMPTSAVAQTHMLNTLGGGVVGTWALTASVAAAPLVNYAGIHFFPDGTFAYAVFHPALGAGNGSGMEYGTYSFTSTQLTLNVVTDLNGAAGGISSIANPLTVSYSNVGNNALITYPGGAIDTFTRLPSNTAGYVGTWKSIDPANNGVSMLVLTSTGDVTYVENDSASPNGLEHGTFTVTGLSPTADSSGTVTI